MEIKETVKQLESLLPKLQVYEQQLNLDQEKEALRITQEFYDLAFQLHRELMTQEKRKHPELLNLFHHYNQFKIHTFDQSVRTTGDSTWTLNPSWTLVVDTPIGTFGVYTLARSILSEFKSLIF